MVILATSGSGLGRSDTPEFSGPRHLLASVSSRGKQEVGRLLQRAGCAGIHGNQLRLEAPRLDATEPSVPSLPPVAERAKGRREQHERRRERARTRSGERLTA
jgi:hypothetical protein